MKSDAVELRPIHVRKKPRARAHVFVATLSYVIEKHLMEKWINLNNNRGGGYPLSYIHCITVQAGVVKYNHVPEPMDPGLGFLSAFSVTLPKTIPCSGLGITKRKKLNLKHKKQ